MKERIYTYKFRLYPNKEQETYLAKALDCCRLAYNHFLLEKQTQYEEAKTSDNYYAQQSKLAEPRRKDEYGFLNEISLQSLQCSLRNMRPANDKVLINIDRFYPLSHLCNVCGYKNIEAKNLNVRTWTIPCCDSEHDRDINTTINILKYKSARIVDYSCEVVRKLNKISEVFCDCSDNYETMNQNKPTSLK